MASSEGECTVVVERCTNNRPTDGPRDRACPCSLSRFVSVFSSPFLSLLLLPRSFPSPSPSPRVPKFPASLPLPLPPPTAGERDGDGWKEEEEEEEEEKAPWARFAVVVEATVKKKWGARTLIFSSLLQSLNEFPDHDAIYYIFVRNNMLANFFYSYFPLEAQAGYSSPLALTATTPPLSCSPPFLPSEEEEKSF